MIDPVWHRTESERQRTESTSTGISIYCTRQYVWHRIEYMRYSTEHYIAQERVYVHRTGHLLHRTEPVWHKNESMFELFGMEGYCGFDSRHRTNLV